MTRDGTKVLVTGASSGIGAAVARALAARGNRVVAAGRRRERLEALAPDSERIVPLRMNVTPPSSVRGAFDRLGGHDHGVDVLINNAGFAAVGSVEAIEPAEVRRQCETNVFGLPEVTRAAVPGMRRRGAGRVVNISRVVGRTTFPGFGVYGASKHAVEALSDALRAELRPFGVDVVLIEPGFVRSEINSTGAASPDAVGGAYRHFTEAIRPHAVDQFEGGADPRELAELLVDVVESRRPRTRYLADALKLRAAGVRR